VRPEVGPGPRRHVHFATGGRRGATRGRYAGPRSARRVSTLIRIGADFQCRVDLRPGEAAPAQKARLAGPFLERAGQCLAEPLGPRPAGERGPVLVRVAQRRSGIFRPDAALHELGADFLRPRAPRGAGRDEARHETLTAEEALLFQAIQGRGDDRGVEAARLELTLELDAAVLAAREKADGALLAFRAGLVAVDVIRCPHRPLVPGLRAEPGPLRRNGTRRAAAHA